MDNFFDGIIAISRGASFVFKNIMDYQLLWGFAIGFLVATLVHALLFGNSSKSLRSIFFDDKAKAFELMTKVERKKDGTYTCSYSNFKAMLTGLRLVFAVSVFIFLLIILISLIKF